MERFYMDLLHARKTLHERCAQDTLRCAVEEWWMSQGWGMPPLPERVHHTTHIPFAGLPRQVASTRYEDRLFQLMAQRIGLRPVWLEYNGDTFFEGSPGKKSLLDFHRVHGKGRKGGWKTIHERHVQNFTAWNKQPLTNLRFDDGRNVIHAHHEWQDQLLNTPTRVDMTPWLKKIGNARQYYIAALSLYLSHGVMFEDFHGGESGKELEKLTKGIFEPAFDEIIRLFGVPPMIVRLPWEEVLGFYPDDNGWNDEFINHLL